MDTKEKRINYKTLTLALTFILTLVYIGTVGLYAESLYKELNNISSKQGRNETNQLNDLNELTTSEYLNSQNQLWKEKLKEAEEMLNFLNEQKQVSIETQQD